MARMDDSVREAKILDLIKDLTSAFFVVISVIGFLFAKAGRPWGEMLSAVGVSGAVGIFTNILAVKMLFRPIYIPLIGVPIPGSGVIAKNRDRILDTFANEVRNRLLTPDALKQAVSDEAFFQSVSPVLQREIMRLYLRRDNLRALLRVLEKPLTDFFSSPGFEQMVRERLIDVERSHFVLSLASKVGLFQVENLTKWIVSLVKDRWIHFLQGEEGLRELQRQVALMLSKISWEEGDAIKVFRETFERIVRRILERIDLGELAKRSLGEVEEGDVEAYLEKLAHKYLFWIEMWGGIVGAIIGLFMGIWFVI